MSGFFSHLFHILNLLEPTQLCKSEQRPSSLPVGPVLTTLGHHQTPTPNSTGTDLYDSFTSHNCPLTFEICVWLLIGKHWRKGGIFCVGDTLVLPL